MKRREFVTTVLAAGVSTPAIAAVRGHDDHRPLDGPLANATVSFGAWPANPDAPFDRMTQPPPPPPPPNHHALVPHTVTIKQGGTVNFIIAGLHQVAIYGPGTKPENIDITNLIDNPAPLPDLINDPVNRVFRGINPIGAPADRVEVVHFPNRGRFLVICAVLPHFNEGMYGWVRVIR